jgi:hypothetical protein
LVDRCLPLLCLPAPLIVKFDVQNITFNMYFFEYHPRERSKRSIVAASAISAATAATIAAVANDIGSQQWQWWGQAMASETEAAAGAHNIQPTDGSDSDRNSIRGSGSGDGGNGAATAAAQTMAAVTAARDIYIKRGGNRGHGGRGSSPSLPANNFFFGRET